MKKLNVAIIGFGRSGMNIHGAHFRSEENRHFNVVAVADPIEARRNKAKEIFSCDTYENYKEIFKRKDIDLVVNASQSHMHYPITLEILENGFNVLCEKPFARRAQECDEMISSAESRGLKLAVFQQSRLAPYFLKIKEVLQSGVLGEIIQISIAFSGYHRRWDWQCAQRFCGGSLLNTGPHPVDQALNLLQADNPQIFSRLARVNTYGDAEDYVKIILTAPGRPLIDLEISSCDGYSDNIYKIQGNRGSLRATMSEVEWKYFIPENEAKREFMSEPLRNENEEPAYCSEKLTWHTEKETLEGTAFDFAVSSFYENLYSYLAENKPLAVPPCDVRRQIAVIEEVHRQNPLSVFI